MITAVPFDAAADPTGPYRLLRACHPALAGDLPPQQAAEFAAHLRHRAPNTTRYHWIVGDPTDPDGYAGLTLPRRGRIGYCTTLLVHPARRRRGTGRALLEAVRARAAEHGAAGLQCWYGDDPAGAAFTAAVGGRTGNRIRQSLLRMPAQLPEVPEVAGYRLRSWTDGAPDELLDSYALARSAINDAPHDRDVPAFRFSADTIRRLEATAGRRGQQLHVTVALDAAGTVAGFTELRVAARPGGTAQTTDTAVVAAHRRRGLARWLKSARLHRLAADRRDVPVVVTANDTTNTAMLAVNVAAGFTPVATQTLVYLEP